MAHGIDIGYFRCRLALLARGLKTRYAELAHRDFPTDTPSRLITLIMTVLDAVIDKIDSADEKLLQIYFRLISAYQGNLAYFDNAHKEQTPRGLIVVLQGLLARISPGALFYAAPQFDYNYGIATFSPSTNLSLEHFLTEQERNKLPSISTATIHLIMFPRAERDNILIHSVFGHEVGHLVAANYLTAEQNNTEYLDAFKSAVSEILLIAPVPSGVSQIQSIKHVASIQNALSKIRKRAMEELISDYVGCLLFGPSALFASYEIFALEDLDLPPSGDALYPPARFRLRFLLEILKEEGFVVSIQELTKTSSIAKSDISYFSATHRLIEKVAALVGDDTDTVVLNQDPINKVAYDWVNNSLLAAKPLIKSLIPADLIFDVTTFASETPYLLDRLALNVPPNELDVYPNTRSPHWQSALNASWIFKLHASKRSGDKIEKFSLGDYEAINRLCLLAVENIALQQEYKSHMAS